MRRPFYILHIEHFFVMNIVHCSSHTTEHTTYTATVLRFICVGMTPLVTFVDASGLVGDLKQLRLPCFDGYFSVGDDLESPSFRLILHPVVNLPMQKLYIN